MKITGQLIGLPIVKKNTETKYQLKEPIYSIRPLKLWGFFVQARHKEKEKRVLLLKKIKQVTEEAVWVNHESDMVLIHQLPDIEIIAKKNPKLIGFDIRDQRGDLIGIIKDTIIDERSGTIKGFMISQGIISDLSTGYSILPLVPEIELVQNEFLIGAFELEELLLNQEGGLKKMLGIDKEN